VEIADTVETAVDAATMLWCLAASQRMGAATGGATTRGQMARKRRKKQVRPFILGRACLVRLFLNTKKRPMEKSCMLGKAGG
jgi:hypothetical protein